MTNSIFDALTDPGVSALLGMAQGFGQAAMPTRMPTPFGAVLGMGAGGLMQGLGQSQALRKASIGNQQAQIGLDWYRQMMNGQGGGGSGTPFGVPSSGGGTDSNGNYMISPRMMASMVPAMVGMGKDPSGVTKLIESYATNGRAIDNQGNVFSIPGASNAIANEAFARARGTTIGDAPGKPPVTIDIPVTDTSGMPVLGADGQPTYRKQTGTPAQINEYLSAPLPASPPVSAPDVTAGLTKVLGSPDAAAVVMRATPTAPLEMLPGMAPIVQANPALKGHTAGSLIQQVTGTPPVVNVPGRGNQIAPQFDSTTGQPLSYSTTAPPMPHGVMPVGPNNPGRMGGALPPGVAGPPVLTDQQKTALEPPVTVDVKSPDGKYTTKVTLPRTSLAAIGAGGIDLNNLPPGATIGGQVPTPEQAVQLKREEPVSLGPGETRVLDPVKAAKGSPPGTGGGADTRVAVPGVEGGAIESPYGPRGEIEPRQKMLTELQETSNGAQKELVQAQLLKQKMHELGSTGPATPFLANLSRYAEQAGFSPETLKKWKLPPGASETEAAALANSLMMEVAKAEFPQRVTNTDLKVAATVKPNPAMPRAAADYLIDNTVMSKAQRDIDRYRHIVPMTMAKLPNGEPNPAYDRELRGIYGALNEFDKNRPLSSYSPVLQPPVPPAAAIDHLKKNPGLASKFDEMYGPGTSRQYLGGQ